YPASEFAALTNFGGGWTDDISFRVDGTTGFQFGATIPSITIGLSTTAKNPDGLSPVLSENRGSDYMTVFGPDSLRITGLPTQPPLFMIVIFVSPFFYDPSKGNLLLEIDITSGATNSVPKFDAWDRFGDSVSRLYTFDQNSSTGIVDTVGLVTRFGFLP